MSSNPHEKGKGKPKYCSISPIDIFGSNVQFNIGGEETFKTYLGFIWTIILVVLMIAATVYYIIQWADTSNVTTTTSLLLSDQFPKFDLNSEGFYMTMVVKKDDKFVKLEEIARYVNISTYMFSTKSSSSIPGDPSSRVTSSETGVEIPMVSCPAAGITPDTLIQGKRISGKTAKALSEFGYCFPSRTSEYKPEFYVQGEDDSDEFAWIEIRVSACKGDIYSQCEIDGSTLLAPDSFGQTSKALDNLEIQLFIIETAVKPEDYLQPLVFLLNGNTAHAISGGVEKSITLALKQVVINTDRGLVFESVTSKETFTLDAVRLDVTNRNPANLYDQKTAPLPSASRVLQGPPQQMAQPKAVGAFSNSRPYITYKIVSSNVKQVYNRSYMKVTDVLSLVGGIANTFTFVVLVLYAWYNSLRMDQELLNKTILHIVEDEDGPALEDWERKRKISLWDMVRYTYFPCCFKKNAKYPMLKRCDDIKDDKLDVIKIIRAVKDIESIKQGMLPSYQKRLLPYVGLRFEDDIEDDPEERLIQETSELTTKQACELLMTHRSEGNAFVDKMNAYIMKSIPNEIKKQAVDHGTSFGRERKDEMEQEPLNRNEVKQELKPTKEAKITKERKDKPAT